MSSPSISLEEFERLAAEALQARAAAKRAACYEIASPTILLHLALVPEWTLPLARDAFGSEMEAALLRLQEAKQVELIQSPLREEQSAEAAIYKLPVTKREEILQEHLSDVTRSLQVQGLVAEAGQRIHEISVDGVPPFTKRWATLARHLHSGFGASFIDAFEDEINRALEKKNTAEVLHWIEAARPLADLLKRNSDLSLELALHRASRRLELFRREENDKRHLRTYLAREEQDAAFRELMEGPDELWALHYIGVGGVGKTMLIRHIQTDLAKEYGAVTARVDFDFLNPDYPRLSPGLLLWAFAQELVLHDTTGRATELFNKADRLLRQLHDELRLDRERFAGQRPTDHPGFREALGLYIEALQQIPSRIILILDTCEELAKVNVGGATPENVEETFRILRALHDGRDSLDEDRGGSFGSSNRLPSLRLIFSGRRPLAQKGHNWSCSNSQLTERPYLRLHEIRGFTPQEARDYLTHKNQMPPLPDHLLDAIIEKSKPTSRVPSLRFDEAQRDEPALAFDDKDRCNPYELKLYADWAKEDPPPTAETILTSSQAKYVELRIIQRLHDKRVERLLPAAALLGHFDRATLRVCTEMNEPDFEGAFERLQQEEWVAQRLVTDGKQTQIVCDVEPRMRARLAAYYEERGSDLSHIRERAADHLEAVTLQGDLQMLDWATFDAALRALEADAPRAAHWWQQVEARLFTERDAKWVLEVTRALQGDDGAVRKKLEEEKNTAEESWMRPLVLATHASALLHSGLGTDLSGIWAEVSQKFTQVPVPEVAARLKLRAFAGSIAAGRFKESTLVPQAVQDFWHQVRNYEPAMDAQLAASLVAAVEAIIENTEQTLSSSFELGQELLRASLARTKAGSSDSDCGPVWLALKMDDYRAQWSQALPHACVQSLAAFAHSLAGRMMCLLGRHNLAASHFYLALNELPKLTEVSSEMIWNDWLPPADVAARVQLEFARAAYPAFLSAVKALEPVKDWDKHPGRSIDSERLYSMIVRLRLANGLIHPDTFPPGWNLETFKQDELFRAKLKESLPETCNAHRIVPPLWATMCEVLAANGEVDLPLQRLGNISSQASLYLTDTVRHAERVHSHIVCRMRLRDTGQGLCGSLVDSPRLADAELVWKLEGLEGEKNQKPIPAITAWSGNETRLRLHAIWRTRYAGTYQSAIDALGWARDYMRHYYTPTLNAEADFVQLALILDLLEAELLAESHRVLPIVAELKSAPIQVAHWAEQHPAQPEEAARLWFRCQALDANFSEPFPAVLNRLGAQKLADIAREEKEFLSLRLPTKVDFSPEKTRCTLAEDFVGATIAGVLDSVFSGKSVRDVRTEYENVRNTPIHKASMTPPLPAWEELEQIAANPQPGCFTQLTPAGWRPMLARIVFCLARERWKELPATNETRQQQEKTLRSEIEQTYGLRSENQIKLTPDWDWACNQNGGAASKTPVTPVSESRWMVVLGLGILLGLFVGGFFLFRWVMSFFGVLPTISVIGISSYLLCLLCLGVALLFGVRLYRGSNPKLDSASKLLEVYSYGCLVLINLTLAFSIPYFLLKATDFRSFMSEFGVISAALLLGGLVAGYLALPKLVKSTQTMFAALSPLTLAIGQSGASASDTGTIKLKLFRQAHDWKKFWTDSWGIVHYDYPEHDVNAPGPVAYQQTAKALPLTLATELKQRAEEAGTRPREVILQLADKMHAPSWEAMIAYQLRSETTRPQDINLHFRRTVKAQRTPSKARLKDAGQILLFTNNWLMLTQGWSQCQSEAGMTISVLGPFEQVSRVPGPVLHLIGEAESTSAGIRFMNSTSANEYRQSVQESSYFDSAYSSMLGPEDLVRDYPETPLCILQGKPLVNAQARLESDRRDAQKLRQFAGELFAQGLPAVLVIPSLPLEVGGEVINKLSAAIAKRPRNAGRELLKTIAEIREAVVALQPMNAEAAWEQAFDVGLYCTDDWHGIARWVQAAIAAGEHKSVEG